MFAAKDIIFLLNKFEVERWSKSRYDNKRYCVNFDDGKCHTKEACLCGTPIRKELLSRNQKIYQDHLSGMKKEELARKYFLSEKSI